MKLLLMLFCLQAHAGKDKDNDGIPNKEDLCAEAPEDVDGFEDEDGCPELDNDRDGKTDDRDQCPNEPGPVAGCPDPAFELFTALDASLKAKDAAATEALFTPEGWATNLAGDSGLAGSEVYAQATGKGWTLAPDPTAIATLGEHRLIRTDVVQRADGAKLDSVWFLLTNREGWRILGGGEDQEQVRALAM